ncbi:unnamed protein product [Diatraea saccharalis]|uniref:Uncharacterized protein n=1 Tax=Diatraea saccharalis TaxID=40085 RepID=A0A9N9WIJ2_9NEOP|nr:unnamed protein product [Diatraea saccharalis]
MAIRQLLFLLINYVCAKNALAQIVPYNTNGCCQRPPGNQNQMINLQQPVPTNFIQNTPINLPITQRPANELTIISNLPVINKAPNNVQIISQVNRLPAYNLAPVNTPPNLNNILNFNQISGQPYNNIPIGTNLPIGLINSLPLNNQVLSSNVQPVNQYNYLRNNNPSVPIISQLNNLPLNNLPISAPVVSQLNGLQIGNLPIIDTLLLANLLNINTLPTPNPQPINRVLFNNMPVSNLPVLNNVPSYNTIPIVNNNIPFSNTQPINANLILSNLPIRNNLPVISNQPPNILPNQYQNLNRLALVNALPKSINPNLANSNFLGNTNVVIGQPNNIVPSLPIANNPQYIRNIPNPQVSIQNLPVANDCGCRKSASSMLVEKEIGNSLNEPVVSLNGLQLGGLGGLGVLPLYKGLPVIGMTESIVNLDSCNCSN